MIVRGAAPFPRVDLQHRTVGDLVAGYQVPRAVVAGHERKALAIAGVCPTSRTLLIRRPLLDGQGPPPPDAVALVRVVDESQGVINYHRFNLAGFSRLWTEAAERTKTPDERAANAPGIQVNRVLPQVVGGAPVLGATMANSTPSLGRL